MLPSPEHVAPAMTLRMASAVSGHLDPALAAESLAASCLEALGGVKPDIATLFISAHHVPAASRVLEIVRRRLDPLQLVGVSGEMVLGGETEMENAPGISILAGVMPGVRAQVFSVDHLPALRDDNTQALATAAGFGPDHRATILLCDPFSVPTSALLPALSRARAHAAIPGPPGERASVILGGFASASHKPGGNVLFLNDRIFSKGGVGLSLSGALRVDALVSQGCKPIGPPLVITGGKEQLIASLGGRPAVQVLTEILDALDEASRQKLRGGLFLGRAVNEYKSRFGRGDFVCRNVIGVDKDKEILAVADLIRVGQTVQFHIRDATTAHEDLALLLDAQKLHGTPAGVLLCTSNGRGRRLFQQPNHDVTAFARAFAPEVDAANRAKGGVALPPARSGVPLAGFFCAGEIGPMHERTYVHGQTASAAVFRGSALP